MEKENLNKDGVLLLLSATIELAKQDLNIILQVATA